METLLRELRFAIRNLARRPGFAATVIGTLTLGIAATTVVFSLVAGSLLRPPPFLGADRLVVLYRTASQGEATPRLTRWSYPRLTELARTARSFEAIASFGPNEINLGGGGEPERVTAEVVSASYFPLLRVGATLGRTFAAEEDSTPGTHPVVVVGHELWIRRFGADTGMLGRPIRANGELVTVIGVLPPGFRGLTGKAELWVPRMMAPKLTYQGYLTSEENFISVAGRLREGVTLAAARAELETVGNRIATAFPDEENTPTRWSATAVPLGEARVDAGNRRALLFLFGAVGFLLLLACTNVAGLGLAQSISRRHEITVRLALGASRRVLARQLMTESLVLGLTGGALGALLAAYLVRAVRLPSPPPSAGNMYGAVGDFGAAPMDGAVLGFSLLASLVAVMLSGLVPAIHAGRADLALELKDRTASTGGSRRLGGRLQSSLVVAEVALALVLSIGGGLLFKSLQRLQGHPVGVDADQVLTFRIQPSDVRYPADRAPELLDRVVAAVEAVPRVRSVTVDACAPLGTTCANSTLYIVGRPEPAPDQAPPVMRHYVAPGHFTTLGIPVLAGRAFTADDRADRPNVAIINQTAANRFFPGQSPLGQRVWFGGGSRFSHRDSSATIVGVVGDVSYGSIERGPVPSVYTPYRQFSYAQRMVMARIDGDPMSRAGAIRGAVAGVDDLPIFDIRPLSDRLGDAWARTRFAARLMGGFAALALLFAVGGVYGIVTQSVNQRTRELGIRTAVGATAADLRRLVVGQGVALAAWGVAIGVLAALALGRLMGALLFEVSPADPTVFVALAAASIAAAGLASYLPARRAAAVDPVISLRAD